MSQARLNLAPDDGAPGARYFEPVELVLFDLDGTLADTAPDLAAAVNRMRTARGQPPVPLAELRPRVSHGARGMIEAAFGIGPLDAEFAALRDEFLREYEIALCHETLLFPQMAETLSALEDAQLRWGIVTNKNARYTGPLVQALGLHQRAACVVSGDTAAFPKPHPAPLVHALEVAGACAARAVYVGDDLRDVQAGRAAGVRTVAAAYGYLGNGIPIAEWGADFVIQSPLELLAILVP
jgi:phosphoglycolate phosphatase